MGRTACTEPHCLYNGALYLFHLAMYATWRAVIYVYVGVVTGYALGLGYSAFSLLNDRGFSLHHTAWTGSGVCRVREVPVAIYTAQIRHRP